MNETRSPYPLRLKPGVREQAQRLADEQDRPLNWMLNELIGRGLASLAAQNKNASAAGTAEASM